jgi:hypothetical protein
LLFVGYLGILSGMLHFISDDEEWTSFSILFCFESSSCLPSSYILVDVNVNTKSEELGIHPHESSQLNIDLFFLSKKLNSREYIKS